MTWKKLSDSAPLLKRGTLFRTPAQSPFEDWVDFMLMDDWQSPSSFSLWVCSGRQAGNPLVRIPREATDPTSNAVQKSWLIENWQQWVYADAKPEQVYVHPPYSIESNWKEKEF